MRDSLFDTPSKTILECVCGHDEFDHVDTGFGDTHCVVCCGFKDDGSCYHHFVYVEELL